MKIFIHKLMVFIKKLKQNSNEKILKKYYGIGSFFFLFFSGAFASIPIVEISTRLFGVDLHGFPKFVVDLYRYGRDLFIDSFINIIEFISFSLSVPFISDLIVIYVFLAFCIIRGSLISRDIDRIQYDIDPETFREQLRNAAQKHNQDADKLIEKVERGMNDVSFHRYRSISSGIRWPKVIFKNWKQVISKDLGDEHAIGLILIWMSSIISALLGAGVYIIWNAIIS